MNSKSYESGAVLYEIPHFVDDRGAIDVLEIAHDLPFECRRIFYTYAVSKGQVRGEHAHKRCEQFLVAVHGAVRVTVDNGIVREEFMLDSPSKGLWLPAGCWGEQRGHSPDSILLVLASLSYDSADYIRSYEEFLKWKKGGR